MNWFEIAIESASEWHLEKEVSEEYCANIVRGLTPKESAIFACYSWDVVINGKLEDKHEKGLDSNGDVVDWLVENKGPESMSEDEMKFVTDYFTQVIQNISKMASQEHNG